MRRLHQMIITGVLVLITAAGCASGTRSPASATPPAAVSTPSMPGVEASATPAVEGSAAVAPGAAASPDGSALGNDTPSRIVVRDLGIDLPVVSGDLIVAGNAPDYPLCDVAQYLTTYRHPDRPGTTTWIYAHARPGMFLSLLETSEKGDGAALIGSKVEVYSTGGRRYTYRVTEVHRHAVDRSLALVSPEARRLVLQTSEGPRGTVPKLQVAADFISVTSSTMAEAMPPAVPRDCHE